MTRRKQTKPDWPGVAAKFAVQVSHAALHPTAMHRALAEHRRESRSGRRPSRWGLACSGGADSLALLLLFWAEGPGRWGRDFIVLHFNHRLRGREADADEKFCRDVCAALDVTFVAGRWQAAPESASEAEARAARLDFFQREMKRRKMRLLWLAHQQDDIAESMLMRLARGSGSGGLAAPRPVQVQADGRLHLRPMLTLSKAQITSALAKAGAVWREDATNATGDFFRNRVRRDVLPRWKKAAQRDAVAGAALARELLEEDDTALEAWLAELKPLAANGSLNLGKLAGKPRGLVRRALHHWMRSQLTEIRISRQAFEALLHDVVTGRETRHSLGRDHFAVVGKGRLRCVSGRK